MRPPLILRPSRRHAVRVSSPFRSPAPGRTSRRPGDPSGPLLSQGSFYLSCARRGRTLSTQVGTVSGRRHLSMSPLSERVSRVHFPPRWDLKQRNTQPATDCRWRWCYPSQGHWYDATDSAAWRLFIIIASMPIPGQTMILLLSLPHPSPETSRGRAAGPGTARLVGMMARAALILVTLSLHVISCCNLLALVCGLSALISASVSAEHIFLPVSGRTYGCRARRRVCF